LRKPEPVCVLLQQCHRLAAVVDCFLQRLPGKGAFHGEGAMNPATHGAIAGSCRLLQGAAQRPFRLRPMSQEGVGKAQPEIKPSGERGIRKPIQTCLLLQQSFHELLATAKKMEGFSEPQHDFQGTTISILAREPLRVEECRLKRRDRFGMGV
jgi:hypothetical protein